jgi:hypothetical protein
MGVNFGTNCPLVPSPFCSLSEAGGAGAARDGGGAGSLVLFPAVGAAISRQKSALSRGRGINSASARFLPRKSLYSADRHIGGKKVKAPFLLPIRDSK